MKKQSEAECIAKLLKKSSGTSCKLPIDECLNCKVYWRIADSILTALKRRGWRAPKRANKKRNSLSDTHEHRTGLQM